MVQLFKLDVRLRKTLKMISQLLFDILMLMVMIKTKDV